LKAFPDESGKHWTRSIKDLNLEILCGMIYLEMAISSDQSELVSQFTLQATFKGTKPDFHLAMPSEKSRQFCKIKSADAGLFRTYST
jgi:D-aminoacyl-tRNA deacylase